jgi:hypothetical protein
MNKQQQQSTIHALKLTIKGRGIVNDAIKFRYLTMNFSLKTAQM